MYLTQGLAGVFQHNIFCPRTKELGHGGDYKHLSLAVEVYVEQKNLTNHGAWYGIYS